MNTPDPAAAVWLMTPDAPEPPRLALEDLYRRPEWQRQASCRGMGPDAHFPALGRSLAAARAACARCAVRDACLAFALADPSLEGVWGGTSERERRQLRRDANVPRPVPGDVATAL